MKNLAAIEVAGRSCKTRCANHLQSSTIMCAMNKLACLAKATMCEHVKKFAFS
jgi:hypothetical protein